MADCPKPVIAAVHGYCIGGGVDLTSACDIRLASADAVFSVRETKVAIVADLGSLQRLPQIIGKGHVAELAYTGQGHQRRPGQGDRTGERGVRRRRPPWWTRPGPWRRRSPPTRPLAVEGTKAVLTAGEGRSVAEGLDYVATWNAGFLQSDDLVEAMAAFMAKRAPEFRGR